MRIFQLFLLIFSFCVLPTLIFSQGTNNDICEADDEASDKEDADDYSSRRKNKKHRKKSQKIRNQINRHRANSPYIEQKDPPAPGSGSIGSV